MTPEIAILVSSFERPRHLERVLASIGAQRGVEPSRMEVVVTDDGSSDDTPDVVAKFARSVSFRVSLTTHAHEGFQLARCRNEGVVASTAPYLLFLDGDCLAPPTHVCEHLRRRRQGGVMAGYCCLLSRRQTEQLTVAQVLAAEYLDLASANELSKLRRMDRKARWYEWLRHSTKPKLFGGNVGISREHYLRVNGYDENFVGWGCEDDDLRLRLRAAGIRIHSILRWTHTYHLWHPVGKTTPALWKDGRNVSYLNRIGRTTRAPNGVGKYFLHDGPRVDVERWNVSLAKAS